MKRKFEERLALNEMANVPPTDTGLDYVVWISVKTGKERHGSRLKVLVDGQFVSVPFSLTKVDLDRLLNYVPSSKANKVKKWINVNKLVLLNYWESGLTGTPSTKETLRKLKRLE